MTNQARSVRSFTEIAELIAEETATPSDAFAEAFTETVDGFRIEAGSDVTDAGMPDALEVQLATEMVLRTLFDVLRDTRLECLSDRFACPPRAASHDAEGPAMPLIGGGPAVAGILEECPLRGRHALARSRQRSAARRCEEQTHAGGVCNAPYARVLQPLQSRKSVISRRHELSDPGA